MAMLVLLETLSPDERAVFVLREVFGFDYDEIAGAVGKSAAAVRQMAHRAREHVQARRKRFEPVDPTQTARDHRTVPHRRRRPATWTALLALLAPDATWTADSGGKAIAVAHADRRRREGSQLRSSRLFRVAGNAWRICGSRRRSTTARPRWSSTAATSLEGVFLIEITDGKITNFYAMRNPDKLAGDRGPARRSAASSLSRLSGADRAARRSGRRPRGAAGRRRRRAPGVASRRPPR